MHKHRAVIHDDASDISSLESSHENVRRGNVVHATKYHDRCMADDMSSSESSYESVERRNVAVVRAAAKNYERHVARGKADDMSSSESSLEGEEDGQAAVIHSAAKDYDKHAARGNSAVVQCVAKNRDRHRHSSHGKAAVPHTAPKAVAREADSGNSNANHIKQNPVFNIQVPVTTSVAQTSP